MAELLTDDLAVWDTSPRGGYATLLAVDNVPDDHELTRGVALARRFPSNATFRMNPKYPRDKKLADAIHSASGVGVPVVSAKLRQAIEAFTPPDVEFLPVTILDHKGGVASDKYFICNPTRVVDCIDQQASRIAWNPIDPTLIADVVGLVLDPARLDPDAGVFRPRFLPTRVLLRGDVAAALRSGGFSGLKLVSPADVGR